MHALAISYSQAGRRQEALQLTETVGAAQKRTLGEEHPETLRTMHNLANSYSEAGRRQEALQLTSATWACLASSARLRRSSQTVSVIGKQAWIFGGELVPRKPIDAQFDVVELSDGMRYPHHSQSYCASY
jgi:hypothetical protein